MLFCLPSNWPTPRLPGRFSKSYLKTCMFCVFHKKIYSFVLLSVAHRCEPATSPCEELLRRIDDEMRCALTSLQGFSFSLSLVPLSSFSSSNMPFLLIYPDSRSCVWFDVCICFFWCCFPSSDSILFCRFRLINQFVHFMLDKFAKLMVVVDDDVTRKPLSFRFSAHNSVMQANDRMERISVSLLLAAICSIDFNISRDFAYVLLIRQIDDFIWRRSIFQAEHQIKDVFICKQQLHLILSQSNIHTECILVLGFAGMQHRFTLWRATEPNRIFVRSLFFCIVM